MQYDLERMSALGFQDAVAALAVAQFGPVVRRLGRGKDGGRDMEAHGVVVWSRSSEQREEVWDGHTVFQVKHRERPARSAADARWLWTEIQKELAAWSDPDSDRDKVPQSLVFLSNVRLSPAPRSGGLAFVENRIQTFLKGISDPDADDGGLGGREVRLRRQRLQPLKNWKVVDGNQLESWLDAHQDVRRAYGAFLTPGDVLADLLERDPTLPAAQLEPALQGHARGRLISDRNVYFDEAGGDGAGVPIDQVAVDLPVRVRATGEGSRAIVHALDRGEHVLKRSVSTVDKPRHLVLTGAPGNGKTTITRFLVQAYRAAMLSESGSLADDHTVAIEGTSSKLELLRRGLPSHRRWPIRVDLAAFAKGYVENKRRSLMAFIARQVTAESYSRGVEPWHMKAWMGSWPWFVALDGLDEVAEPAVRKWVIGCIHEFVADAEADDADLFCLVTTRPTGYVDELSSSQFDRVDLSDLSPSEALAYGHLVTEVRVRTDRSRVERVDALLQSAAENESLRHLLRTPLQVQIMTIIAEQAGPLDPDRFRLFWRYYEVVARREQSKEFTRYATLIRDHGPQILDLHERVGLELQRRSESGSGATASMTEADLQGLAWHVLADEGYEPSGRDRQLLERIVKAATHRLVLLVPRPDGYGFDVRSLQELMAARRITTGEPEVVGERLRTLAPSPHWRNTWLFAAGRIFSEPQSHQHRRLIELVEGLDVEAAGRFASIAPVAPYLAWDILDDGMAASRPRWLQRLVAVGMRCLEHPAPQPVADFTDVLVRMCTISAELRDLVRDCLRGSLLGDRSSRTNAAALQAVIEAFAKTRRVETSVRALARIKAEPGRSPRPDPDDPWGYFEEAISLAPDESSGTVAAAAATIQVMRGRAPVDPDFAALEEVALDADATEVLEIALERVVRVEPIIASLILELAHTMTDRRELASQMTQDLQ